MHPSIGSINIRELLRPKVYGEQVNTTVQEAAHEPRPDYEAMQRLVSGLDEVPSFQNGESNKYQFPVD